MEYSRGVNAITEALRAAEMRQGCTNHSYYAEILLKELGFPDMYKALKELKGLIEGELEQANEALAKAKRRE